MGFICPRISVPTKAWELPVGGLVGGKYRLWGALWAAGRWLARRPFGLGVVEEEDCMSVDRGGSGGSGDSGWLAPRERGAQVERRPVRFARFAKGKFVDLSKGSYRPLSGVELREWDGEGSVDVSSIKDGAGAGAVSIWDVDVDSSSVVSAANRKRKVQKTWRLPRTSMSSRIMGWLSRKMK